MADILIVDDNPDIREAMEALVASEGHDVRLAPHGAAGLEALNQRLPDVILLDVEMPILDGPSMVHELLIENAGRERIPVVLVSAAPGLSKIAKQVGTPYMVSKPCDIDKLFAVLGQALAERTGPSPARPRA